jgi:hypothetical protein
VVEATAGLNRALAWRVTGTSFRAASALAAACIELPARFSGARFWLPFGF